MVLEVIGKQVSEIKSLELAAKQLNSTAVDQVETQRQWTKINTTQRSTKLKYRTAMGFVEVQRSDKDTQSPVKGKSKFENASRKVKCIALLAQA